MQRQEMDYESYVHETETESGGFRDASRKMYTGALNRILNEADLILEVLDARDPNGCRTKQVLNSFFYSFSLPLVDAD